mmetsp:Transcript_7490/g.10147  ORF Transcript_7490/g.10147 Transcript_7490/m.10147 type:complete len:120 (-) Transcript_7490:376-735(-)
MARPPVCKQGPSLLPLHLHPLPSLDVDLGVRSEEPAKAVVYGQFSLLLRGERVSLGHPWGCWALSLSLTSKVRAWRAKGRVEGIVKGEKERGASPSAACRLCRCPSSSAMQPGGTASAA